MPQSLFVFQYEKDPTRSKLAALGGIPMSPLTVFLPVSELVRIGWRSGSASEV